MIAQGMQQDVSVARTRIELDMVRLYGDLRARAFALTKDRDAANDLVQQACERGLRLSASIGQATNTAAWLRCVMRNLFVDEYRFQRKHARLLCDPEVESNEPRRPALADLLMLEDVKDAISSMREEDRAILELALLEGRSYRDISSRLGILPKTVGTRLFRAKAKLRKQMQAVYDQRLTALVSNG